MIRISQIKLPISHSPEDLRKAAAKKLRISHTKLLDLFIVRKSIDARRKDRIRYIYTIDLRTANEKELLKHLHDPDIAPAPDHAYHFPAYGEKILNERPVIIGSGPAGLFAAYFLAEKGFRPLVIERGDPVEERIRAVERFWSTGELDPSSNIQFGEGGAGTFSDGKLNSGIHDTSGRKGLVLRTFVQNGAPEEILYSAKPHLGTDVLVRIVANMRNHIIEKGGEFRYRTVFTKFLEEGGRISGIIVNDRELIPCEAAVLAIGHSARDTFDYLIRGTGLQIDAKPFAVGVRAEHKQERINLSQYGPSWPDLPPAEYKLTYQSSRGTSIYSFCMCPGGYVVNSSSEPGCLCVNGMSYSGRDSENANSAIVAAVRPSDDPLENIAFQRQLEQKAYQLGRGKIVSQRLEDFENDQPSSSYGSIRPVHKGDTVLANIREIFPAEICEDLAEAMHHFAGQIEGFDDPDVILSAVESRTSSPVRILRDETLQTSVRGLYPAGEGAGYAGGITSAAVDGIRVFEAILNSYRPNLYSGPDCDNIF